VSYLKDLSLRHVLSQGRLKTLGIKNELFHLDYVQQLNFLILQASGAVGTAAIQVSNDIKHFLKG
jgi:hypothetical protein